MFDYTIYNAETGDILYVVEDHHVAEEILDELLLKGVPADIK